MRATPSELWDQFRSGAFDKHEYSRRIGEHYLTLRNLTTLLAGSDIEAVELTSDGVTFVSRFDGARFPCDPGDRGIPPVVAVNFGSYEAKDFAMVRALVPRGGTFLDIGANIGWYSIHVGRSDPTHRIIALEPIPSSFRWFRKAIAANGLANVSALNVAAGADAGSLTLFVDPSISGAASSAPSAGEAGLEQIKCPVVTIDAVMRDHGGRVDFLKLDIEGAELLALRGARETLTRDRPIVFSEMLRKLARPFGYHPNEIIALMSSLGYQCYRAEARRLIEFTTMDEETVETNFYFLHRDAHKRERDSFVGA